MPEADTLLIIWIRLLSGKKGKGKNKCEWVHFLLSKKHSLFR